MKKLLLSLFAVASLTANAQVTVFEDGFESYPNFAITGFGNWQTLDIDLLLTYTGGLPDGAPAWPNAGDPQAFMVFNPTAAGVTNSTDACTATLENRNFDPHTGSKYAGSWAGVPSTTGGAIKNEDWLISPVLNLGTSNNELKFWIKQLSSCYGTEKFRVGVYVGTGTPTSSASFTIISGALAQNASVNWAEKTYALNAYSNQSIRIGIKNESEDAYFLMVDDFKVTSSNLGVNDLLAAKFSLFPNPTNGSITITNSDAIRVHQIEITDLNGRIITNKTFTDALSELQMNISDLSTGMYLMTIHSDQGSVTKKIIRN